MEGGAGKDSSVNSLQVFAELVVGGQKILWIENAELYPFSFDLIILNDGLWLTWGIRIGLLFQEIPCCNYNLDVRNQPYCQNVDIGCYCEKPEYVQRQYSCFFCLMTVFLNSNFLQ